MHKMGWRRGQSCGVSPLSERCVHEFSAASHPELWETLAGTLGQRNVDLSERVKRHCQSVPVAVPFHAGETLVQTVAPLSWHELAQALVAMTQYAFSDTVHVWDVEAGVWKQESFHWSFTHMKLSARKGLPCELQQGMRQAGNEDTWTGSMEALLEYRPYYWKVGKRYTMEYLGLVGKLWKTLEVAMNQSALPLEFCIFFCGQVMEALRHVDGSRMSFVPTLTNASRLSTGSTTGAQAHRFEARVRYKAEGLRPEKRYGSKVSRRQAASVLLLRPFLAAQGVLPDAPSGSVHAKSSPLA